MVNWEAIQRNAEIIAATGELLAIAAERLNEQLVKDYQQTIRRCCNRIDEMLRDDR